jgi:hypothetical protein
MGIWPSGQSGGLARRRSRFVSRQGRPLYIWMYTPALRVYFGGDIALYKNPHIIYDTNAEEFSSLLVREGL